jgi:hypothetical protein
MNNISRVPTLYDWLRLPNSHLFRAYGVDPKRRVDFTGHRTTMRHTWVRSIGLWGGGDWNSNPKVFNAADPSKGVIKVPPPTFYGYKCRHRLYDPVEFCAHYGNAPWMRAEASYAAIKRQYRRAGAPYAIGRAAFDFVQSTHRAYESERLGLLPVEVVLYARIFHVLLDTYALSLKSWRAMSEHDKKAFWKHEPELRVPGHYVHLPGIDRFRDGAPRPASLHAHAS